MIFSLDSINSNTFCRICLPKNNNLSKHNVACKTTFLIFEKLISLCQSNVFIAIVVVIVVVFFIFIVVKVDNAFDRATACAS